MSEATAKSNIVESNQLDLIELIENLWKEKITIFITAILIGAMSIVYAQSIKPIFSISVNITSPEPVELNGFKIKTIPTSKETIRYTPEMAITPPPQNTFPEPNSLKEKEELTTEKALSKFLSVLNSNAHIIEVAYNNEKLITQALGLVIDDNLIEGITSRRKITASQKIHTTLSSNYTLSIEGIDRSSLKDFIRLDLTTAKNTTLNLIRNEAIGKISQRIAAKKRIQDTTLESLKNTIDTHKTYLQGQHNKKLRQLKKALKIATTLNIEEPTTQSQLSEKGKKAQFRAELSNTPPELYLKGKKLLKIEIEILETETQNMFLEDDNLMILKAQKLLLANNVEVQALEEEKRRLVENTKELTFYELILNAPTSPTNIKKPVIAASGFLLGGIFGIFFAILKISLRKYTSKKAILDD